MALGAVLGLLGSVGTNVVGIFREREANKLKIAQMGHEERRWGHDEAMVKLTMQARQEETEQEALLMDTQGSWDGLQASILDQTASVKRAAPWAATVLTLFRPFITLSFIAIILWLAIYEADAGMREAAIGASVELVLLSVTWWFGDRSTKRVLQATAAS